MFKDHTSPSVRLKKTQCTILKKDVDKKTSPEADSVLYPQTLPYTLAPSCGIALVCTRQNKLKPVVTIFCGGAGWKKL